MSRVFCFLSLLFLSCVPPQSFPFLNEIHSATDIHSANEAVVALVQPRFQEVDEGPHGIYCSGVFVLQHYVLTAAHCVDNPSGEIVFGQVVRVATHQHSLASGGSFVDNNWVNFEVVDFDVTKDLALLRRYADGRRVGPHSTLPLSRRAPEYGHDVLAVGHPRGLGWSVTAGIVSHPRRRVISGAIDALFVQASAQAYYGNSGGALVDSDNYLIGIVSNGGPWHIVMSVHLEEIRLFLRNSIL